MKKLIGKCKSDASTITTLNEKICEAEDQVENLSEKFKKSHEAQKLAEVKVMELEQRLTLESQKAENMTNEAAKIDSKFNETARQAKQLAKRNKELEKDRKNIDSLNKQLQAVMFTF